MKEERILLREKETKGTYRFMEAEKEGQPMLIRNIYISKWSPLATATAVKVTIETVE